MKWDMQMEEIEAILEKIWDLHDKLSDAIHSVSRSHFLTSLKTLKNSSPLPNSAANAAADSSGFVFVKDFRPADDDDDSAVCEAKSLNAIRTALENLEDQLEFFHVSFFFPFSISLFLFFFSRFVIISLLLYDLKFVEIGC